MEMQTNPGTPVPWHYYDYDLTTELGRIRATIAFIRESLATARVPQEPPPGYDEWQQSLDYLCEHGHDSGPDVTPSQEPNPYGTSSERSDG